MVIFQIHIVGIASLKAKGDPPVGSYRNRPNTSAVALERMQSKRGLVHILHVAGLIQRKD